MLNEHFATICSYALLALGGLLEFVDKVRRVFPKTHNFHASARVEHDSFFTLTKYHSIQTRFRGLDYLLALTGQRGKTQRVTRQRTSKVCLR